MNALLNYPGAKWGIAQEISAIMPPHRSYLEPFFGSGAVLFNKPPSAIETVNDIDGDVVNFFTILREYPEELAQRIYLTPYSRDVFDDAYNDWGTDPIDRAHRFVIRSKMSHGFKMHHKSGFKIDVQGREKAYCVEAWNRIPDNLMKAAIRLKDVQIENRPALDIIRRFNYENVLIYADPPYLMETRCCAQYRHEMTEQDHIDLLAALLQHKGPVILSGYPCVYHENGKCLKHTEPDYVDFCVFGPCHEQTPSRGDRFRCMTDEQLAEYLATNTDKFCKNLPECGAMLEANTPIPEEMCKACALKWLKEPAEVE